MDDSGNGFWANLGTVIPTITAGFASIWSIVNGQNNGNNTSPSNTTGQTGNNNTGTLNTSSASLFQYVVLGVAGLALVGALVLSLRKK